MLVCPKCKSEYQEGVTICSDCNCALIEEPDAKEIKEERHIISYFTIVPFLIGIILIAISPLLSFRFTSMYFLPNGEGSYQMKQFVWMLHAFHYSFILIGIIICLPFILYWFRNCKRK